jgi:hypothetical protein
MTKKLIFVAVVLLVGVLGFALDAGNGCDSLSLHRAHHS